MQSHCLRGIYIIQTAANNNFGNVRDYKIQAFDGRGGGGVRLSTFKQGLSLTVYWMVSLLAQVYEVFLVWDTSTNLPTTQLTDTDNLKSDLTIIILGYVHFCQIIFAVVVRSSGHSSSTVACSELRFAIPHHSYSDFPRVELPHPGPVFRFIKCFSGRPDRRRVL